MNIEYFKYFLDVARNHAITQAAQDNFMSPQGMSRAINELEKSVGCKLFDRQPNKISLSREGEALLPYASKIVGDYAEFTDKAFEISLGANSGKGSNGKLRFLGEKICSIGILPPTTMGYLLDNHEEIDFREMTAARMLDIISKANEGSKQRGSRDEDGIAPFLGIIVIFDAEDQSHRSVLHQFHSLGYSYQPYLVTPDMAIVSKDSPLASKDCLSHADILSYPLATTDGVLYECIAKRFGEDSISVSTGEFKLRRDLVEKDRVISFLPAICQLVLDATENIKFINFDDAYQVEVGFVGRKQDFASPLFKGFVKSLNEFYSPLRSTGLFEFMKAE